MIKEAIERGSSIHPSLEYMVTVVDEEGPKPKEPTPKKPRTPKKKPANKGEDEDEARDRVAVELFDRLVQCCFTIPGMEW